MKVLYINPVFLSYRIPFYKKLKELFNNDFYVLYSTKRYIKKGVEDLLPQIKMALGSNAIEFKTELIYDVNKKSFNKYGKEKGRKIPFTLGLIRNILKIHPDVLISEGFYQWTPFAVIYSFIMRAKLFIGYERTLHTERNTGILLTTYRKLINLFVTGYLVNGTETQKYLISIGVSPQKIFIGGMNADSRGLREAIANYPLSQKKIFKQQFINTNDNGLIYLFSGQIIERKGLIYLLNAWKKHILVYPNDRLIIIGGGSLLKKYQTLFSTNNSIYLEGKIPYNEVYKYYAIADIFILPTLEDNWSLVIPEAMSCGLPVATSIYNGCHVELVKKGYNGITFDTYKEDTIINALDYFHHVDLKKFGSNSIELEKQFDTDHCAYRVFNAINNITKWEKK